MATEVDTRVIESASQLEVLMELEGDGSKTIVVSVMFGGLRLASGQTDDRDEALTMFNHPFSVIRGAADALKEMEASVDAYAAAREES